MKNKNNRRTSVIFWIFVGIVSLILSQLHFGSRLNDDRNERSEYLEGIITSVSDVQGVQILDAEVLHGSREGQTLRVENTSDSSVNSHLYERGDKVFIASYEDFQTGENIYYVMDYARRSLLIWAFSLFVFIVLLVTRWQGFRSLIGMGFTFLVLFKFLLPLLLQGYNALLLVIVSIVFILPVLFYLSHGINRKTSVALVSTLFTLFVTALLALIFTKIGQFSGLSSEEASFLKLDFGDTLNFQGLLLAGIIVSLMGILDDVTISQASVVEELKAVKSEMSFGELYGRAMKVGRDHISSLVNTLVLVYAGAALPLLLLFLDSSTTFQEVLNFEFMAEEIMRTLIGSTGLILAVPITTLMSVMFITGEKGEQHRC